MSARISSAKILAVALAWAAAASAACVAHGTPASPNGPLSGLWVRGGVSGDHSGLYLIELEQDGRTLSGVACRLDGDQVIFSRAPVHGWLPAHARPSVSFTVPPNAPVDSYAGAEFTGRVVNGDIQGYLVRRDGSQLAITFSRSEAELAPRVRALCD